MRRASEEQLAKRLQVNRVSPEMTTRVLRRFGSEETLMGAYRACKGRHQQQELLADLSSAACNSMATKDSLKAADLREDNQRIWRSMMREGLGEEERKETGAEAGRGVQCATRRYVAVSMCERMKEVLEQHQVEAGALFLGMDVNLTLADAQDNMYPWCEITTRRLSPSFLTSSSSSSFIVLLTGQQVLEALAASFDALQGSVRAREGGGDSLDLLVVQEAVKRVEEGFSSHFKSRLRGQQQLERSPQVVLLLENLGNGCGVHGACGRLKKLHAEKLKERSQGGAGGGEAGAGGITLGGGGRDISFEAACFLTSQLHPLLNLFFAFLFLERGFHLLHTKHERFPTNGDVTSELIAGMHDLALLVL